MTPWKISAALAGLSLLAAPVLAHASEPGEPVASARPSDLDAQIADYLNSAPPLAVGDEGAPSSEAAPPDRAVHGEVGAGIGTNGYRHAHAVVTGPLGDVGTAAMAVSDTRWNGFGGGQRKSQSVSIAVALGAAAAAPPPSCANGPSAEGLEPLWVTRMRAKQGVGCAPGLLER